MFGGTTQCSSHAHCAVLVLCVRATHVYAGREQQRPSTASYCADIVSQHTFEREYTKFLTDRYMYISHIQCIQYFGVHIVDVVVQRCDWSISNVSPILQLSFGFIAYVYRLLQRESHIPNVWFLNLLNYYRTASRAKHSLL